MKASNKPAVPEGQGSKMVVSTAQEVVITAADTVKWAKILNILRKFWTGLTESHMKLIKSVKLTRKDAAGELYSTCLILPHGPMLMNTHHDDMDCC